MSNENTVSEEKLKSVLKVSKLCYDAMAPEDDLGFCCERCPYGLNNTPDCRELLIKDLSEMLISLHDENRVLKEGIKVMSECYDIKPISFTIGGK